MISGGAGYVGCQLIPALLKAGHRVRVIDNLTFGLTGLQHYINQIELIPVDIRDVVATHFDGIEAVIHLASISNDPTAEYDPATTKAVNLDATVAFARLAKMCGVRKFVFASSCSVYYSERPDDRLRDESYPIDPTATYSWSKRQAEIRLLDLAGPNFFPIILRKGTIFGCSGRMRFDLVVNTFTRDAFAKGRLTVHGDGLMWRPLLHIDDAVEIYSAMLRLPEDLVGGQIFNALNGNYQVIQIADEVRRVLQPRLDVDLDLVRQGNSRSYRVDGKKLDDLLKLRSCRSIGNAVAKMWHMLEKGIDYNNSIYYNIRWFETFYDKDLRERIFNPIA
jgi:nucleoside-diphosphate-sugar epimerase